MPTVPKRRFTVTCLLALCLLSGPALARDKDNDGRHGNGVATQSRLSAEQASSIVRRAYGGRVVSVKSAGDGYSVRVLLDGGRIKNVYVDGSGGLHE
jgi:hypothetical protein